MFCVDKLLSILQMANIGQDSIAGSVIGLLPPLSQHYRHYTREFVENETESQRQENRQAAANRYQKYIHDEEVKFYGYLRDRWFGHVKKDCRRPWRHLDVSATPGKIFTVTVSTRPVGNPAD